MATPATAIYREWLGEQSKIEPGATADEIDACAVWAEALLGRSLQAVQGALYTNGCVFSDSSTFPVSAAHALWLAEEKNSLRDWDASKWHAMDATEENVQVMLAE